MSTRSDAFAAGELGGFDSGWDFHAATIPYSGEFAKPDLRPIAGNAG